jgi:aspartate racemase
MTPDEGDRREMDRIIFQELLKGVISPASQAFAMDVIGRLRDQKGCDAVVLASSEAPLLFESAGVAPLPLYHASEILAHHAVRHMKAT